MPRRHQIPTGVLPRADQVPGGLAFHRRDGDRDDLAQMQQPCKVQGVTGIGLDPIPGRALQLRRRRHLSVHPTREQEPGKPETRRPGLVGHRDRTSQRADPRPDLLMSRAQPRAPDLPGDAIKSTNDHRPRVHIQAHTRTLKRHPAPPCHLRRPARPGPIRTPGTTRDHVPAETPDAFTSSRPDAALPTSRLEAAPLIPSIPREGRAAPHKMRPVLNSCRVSRLICRCVCQAGRVKRRPGPSSGAPLRAFGGRWGGARVDGDAWSL